MIWDLDNHTPNHQAVNDFVKANGFDTNTHPVFKVGDTIQFMTGYHNDILAQATIKGIEDNDLYVYNDCYWFPINTEDYRKSIVLVKRASS